MGLGSVPSIDLLVKDAAELSTRFGPPEAFAAAAADAIMIGIRVQDARELYGAIPGSPRIPRTVVERRVAVNNP